MDDIDFVVTWVDGGDERWLAEKRSFEAIEPGRALSDADANAACRYQDNGLLRYWFRAVERFAPFVRKVFFVTNGQKPGWLDESNARLRLVDHREYIPSKWLPTFHSNAIELNLHRISDLSERFVLFNDDMFLLQPLKPEFFFRGGLPVLPCDLGIPPWLGYSNISRVIINNSGALNVSMDIQRGIAANWRKFFSVRSLGPVRSVKNALSFAVNRTMIQGCFGHLALPHLKSTLGELWSAIPEIMERTSGHRFRADDCVNQWLAASWNLASGRFHPANEKRMGRHVTIKSADASEPCNAVRKQLWPQICLNDKGQAADMEKCFADIAAAFAELLPAKSSFEK